MSEAKPRDKKLRRVPAPEVPAPGDGKSPPRRPSLASAGNNTPRPENNVASVPRDVRVHSVEIAAITLSVKVIVRDKQRRVRNIVDLDPVVAYEPEFDKTLAQVAQQAREAVESRLDANG